MNNYYFFIVGAVTFIFAILFFFGRPRQFEKKYAQMQKTNEEELIRLCKEKARGLRRSEPCRGVRLTSYYKKINSAYKAICRKERDKEDITEAERWLYENFGYVYKHIFESKEDLKGLPGVDDMPRIILISDLILENSLDCFTPDRIRAVMKEIERELPLEYDELIKFGYALRFSIVKYIYVLSEKILFSEKCRKKASKNRIYKNYFQYNSYLYHKIQNCENVDLFERNGIDERNVTFSYNESLFTSVLAAKTLFNALREFDELYSYSDGLKNLRSYSILKDACKLESNSVSTTMSYFKKISEAAKKCRCSEEYVGKVLLQCIEKNSLDISEILFDRFSDFLRAINGKSTLFPRNKNNHKDVRFIAATCACTALSCIGIAYILSDYLIGMIAFIPIFMFFDGIMTFLFSFLRPYAELPKLKIDRLTVNNATSVVISAFCSDPEDIKKLIFHAESILDVNKDEYINCILLVDTKSTTEPLSDVDRQITEIFSQTVRRNDLFLFVRKKTFLNGKYTAKERKRGAILALGKYFIEKNQEDFYYISAKPNFDPCYFVALDEDSSVLPGGIKEMVERMAHPYARKYGVISALNRVNLFSIKTLYAERFLSESGFEGYPVYTGVYQKMFNKDVFCGKGIIRVKDFYCQLNGLFPQNRILSHDIPEGAILSCASGGCTFEDAPNDFLSDVSRKKRWMRGDLQNIPFILGCWKDEEGRKIRRHLSLFYRYIMTKNILSLFVAPCITTLILLGAFMSKSYLFIGSILLLLPLLQDIVFGVRAIACGNSVRITLCDLGRTFFRFIEELFLLFYRSVENIILIFTTSIRMIFSKNLLEWKTFSSFRKSSFCAYVAEITPATLCFVAVLTPAFLLGKTILFFYACSYLICFVMLVLSLYFCSTTKKVGYSPDDADRKKMMKYAQATYSYFTLQHEGLIPDNLILKPYKESTYTSPTDIGFSLLSHLCALRLGLISESVCAERIKRILDIVKSLPKWYGILYNWYHIDSLRPTNGFVSSVDAGNFSIALIIVEEYYRNKDENIFQSAKRILDEQELNKLYDEQKKRFFIGFDNGFTGHYDMLCSESRILSFVYIMRYGKSDHYFSLVKEYTSLGGNTLLSWGGTAFEALMPELFFRTPEHSLLYKTAFTNALYQSKTKRNGLWGVSESGYYLFDDEMRYQYKSFGIGKLALSSETNDMVISPYSSFLCLPFLPEKSIKNIYNAEKKGLLCEFGFYESLDCTSNGKTVYQVMAHHQGMILCALTNFLCEDFLKSILNKVPAYASVSNYFNEKPIRLRVSAGWKNENIISRSEKQGLFYKRVDDVQKEIYTACFTDGELSLFANANGSCHMRVGEVALQKVSNDYTDRTGFAFFVSTEDGYVSPTFLPYCHPHEHFFYHSDSEAVYCNKKHGIEQSVKLIGGLNAAVIKLRVKNSADIAFYSDVVLNRTDAYLSHPTFSDLFIHSEKISDDTVLFSRNGKKMFLAVRVTGASAIFNTNRINFLGRGNGVIDPKTSGNLGPAFGDVLTPCFSFISKLKKDDSCQVCIIYSTDKDDLLATVSALPRDMYLYASQNNNLYQLQQKTFDYIARLMYGKIKSECGKNGLNNRTTIRYTGKTKKEKYELLDAYQDLALLGFKTTLAFDKKEMGSSFKKECEKRQVRTTTDPNALVSSDELPEISYCKKPIVATNDRIQFPAILHECGCGGFDGNSDYYITSDVPPAMPYTHIIAGSEGGSLITSCGGGFFWFGNSRENKASRFDNDPVSDPQSEFLTAEIEGNSYSILGGHAQNRYSHLGKGFFTHRSELSGISFAASITAMFDGRARVIEIRIGDLYGIEGKIAYRFYPCLDSFYDPRNIRYKKENHFISVYNEKTDRTLYFGLFGDSFEMKEKDPLPNLSFDLRQGRFFIVFTMDKELLLSLNVNNIPLYCDSFLIKSKEVASPQVVGGSKAFENILSWLPYQITTSRLYARAGFYQVGGAFGFRDQLQDAMAFSFRPEILKNQLLLCCRHQYEEGDVMHWWHPTKFGLRSRITDDKLFLPLAVCRYISLTGDTKILEQEESFLSSEPLSPKERDRFECPEEGEKASVFKHCLAAIRSSLKFGEHRLLIMGTGDWNDGMDEVCAKGAGESVFNSMLAYYVLTSFAEFCPDDLKKELLAIAVDLKNAVNKFAFDTDRYIRLFSDEGEPLGNRGNAILELDLLVQAFAVLSGVADGERKITVLKTCEKLIDQTNGLIKLLTPPQTPENRIGYISDYPAGIRENGGQYTHAAIWYLMALCRVGKQDEAYELFCMINPAEKCSTDAGNKIYKGEPYVFAGDVYFNNDNPGRCGWSWYTGSAAWAYRLVIEEFFGLIRKGSRLFIQPKLPKKLDGSTVTYRYGNSVFLIEYKFGIRNRIMVDGVKADYVELRDGHNCLVAVEIGF